MEIRVFKNNVLLLNLTLNELKILSSVLYSADMTLKEQIAHDRSLLLSAEYAKYSAVKLSSMIGVLGTNEKYVQRSIQNTESYEKLCYSRLKNFTEFEEYLEFLKICDVITFKLAELNVEKHIELEPFLYMQKTYQRMLTAFKSFRDQEYRKYLNFQEFYNTFVNKLLIT